MEFSSYSLYQVVMSLSRLIFVSGMPPREERIKFVELILEQQNPLRGFTFHPTASEQATCLPLVTGEPAQTQLLRFHAFEMETLRLLALLNPAETRVKEILNLADERLAKLCYGHVCMTGECKGATVAAMRFRSAYNPDPALTRTALAALRQHRSDTGRWKGFPFYFTLLWLLELAPDLNHSELQHALPAIERAMRSVDDEEDAALFQREILARASAALEHQTGAVIPLAIS